jgi:hypothetical protein
MENKMTRLNKATREAIIENALKSSGVTTREEALITRRAKLADDVRLFAIGGVEREAELNDVLEKVMKSVKQLDDKLFVIDKPLARNDYEIAVNFAGRSSTLHFNGYEYRTRPLVYKDFVHHERVVITADNPLNDEFDAINKEQRIVDDLRLHVASEVRAMVNSVTTIKKLLEIWPESKDLLPKNEQVQSTALVADVAKLNAMIGLPKDA